MKWTPALSVKVQQFDDQHMVLVEMINALHDAVKAGRGAEILGTTLDGLITYTTTHFGEEEKLMETFSYPDRDEHKAAHENLIKIVQELQQKFTSGQSIVSLDVLMFLRDWLMGHINVVDKKYGAFFNDKGMN